MGGGKREGKNHVGPGGDGQEKVIKSEPHSGSQEWAQGQHVRIPEGACLESRFQSLCHPSSQWFSTN